MRSSQRLSSTLSAFVIILAVLFLLYLPDFLSRFAYRNSYPQLQIQIGSNEILIPNIDNTFTIRNDLLERLFSRDPISHVADLKFVGCTETAFTPFPCTEIQDCILFCIGRKLDYMVFSDTELIHCQSGMIQPESCYEDSNHFIYQNQRPVINNENRSDHYRGCIRIDTSGVLFMSPSRDAGACRMSCKVFPLALISSGGCSCGKSLKYLWKIVDESNCVSTAGFFQAYLTDYSTSLCLTSDYAKEGSIPITGIIAPPGSGTTWTRLSIEHLSGLVSGDVYQDPQDTKLGLQGEGHDWKRNDTIVVKSHNAWLGSKPGDVFRLSSKIITLLRNPLHAAISDWNRQKSNKLKGADPKFFQSSGFHRWATTFINDRWRKVYESLVASRKPVLVLSYEDMISDILPQLLRIRKFLGISSTKTLERAFCTTEIQLSERASKKRKSEFDYVSIAKYNHTLYNITTKDVSNLLAQSRLHLALPFKY